MSGDQGQITVKMSRTQPLKQRTTPRKGPPLELGASPRPPRHAAEQLAEKLFDSKFLAGGLSPSQKGGAACWDPLAETPRPAYMQRRSPYRSREPRGLLTCGGDVKLWRIGRAQARMSMQCRPHGGRAQTACASHNSQVLATGGADGRICLSSLEGKVSAELYPDGEAEFPIRALAFSSRAQYVLSGGGSRTLHLWDISNQRLARVLKGHTAEVNCVAFGRSDVILASGAQNGTILLHNVSQGTRSALRSRSASTSESCTTTVFSPLRGSILGSAFDTGAVRIWDSTEGVDIVSFAKHAGAATGMSFSKRHRSLICSAGVDKTIKFYDINKGCLVSSVAAAAAITCIDFHSDGQTVAVGATNGRVMTYDLRKLASSKGPVLTFNAHASAITSLEFTAVVGAGVRGGAPSGSTKTDSRSIARSFRERMSATESPVAPTPTSRPPASRPGLNVTMGGLNNTIGGGGMTDMTLSGGGDAAWQARSGDRTLMASAADTSIAPSIGGTPIRGSSGDPGLSTTLGPSSFDSSIVGQSAGGFAASRGASRGGTADLSFDMGGSVPGVGTRNPTTPKSAASATPAMQASQAPAATRTRRPAAGTPVAAPNAKPREAWSSINSPLRDTVRTKPETGSLALRRRPVPVVQEETDTKQPETNMKRPEISALPAAQPRPASDLLPSTLSARVLARAGPGSERAPSADKPKSTISVGAKIASLLKSSSKPDAAAGKASQMQIELIRSTLGEMVDELRDELREDMSNMHVEMLRQFHIQYETFSATMQGLSDQLGRLSNDVQTLLRDY